MFKCILMVDEEESSFIVEILSVQVVSNQTDNTMGMYQHVFLSSSGGSEMCI